MLAPLTTAADITNNATGVLALVTGEESVESSRLEAEQLGVDLLVKIARLEESSFKELQSAIAEEREGRVTGLINEMTHSNTRTLNAWHRWTKAQDFQLPAPP